MNPQDHVVFVVDDDRRICEALAELLSTYDLHVVTFGSAAEYLASSKPDIPACLVLDVQLPDINGLDLLKQPGQLKEADLMRAIHAALAQDRVARLERAELAELHGRLSCLTPRERDVLPLIVSGLLNKQAAAELAISEITVQIHRGRIMKKMRAGSLAELVRIAGKLEIPLCPPR